jgi:PAS domain-containing protein
VISAILLRIRRCNSKRSRTSCDAGALTSAWKASIHGRRVFEMPYRLRSSSGGYRWMLGHAEPIWDANGRVARWVGASTDVDDRKQIEKSLLRAQANVTALFSGNPQAMWLLDVIHPGERGWKELEEVLKAAERASTLTRQLLTFSRQEALEPVSLDLNNLVENIASMLERLIGARVDPIRHARGDGHGLGLSTV